MSIKAEIKSVNEGKIVQTGERFLEVIVHLVDGSGKKKKIVQEKKFGFPIDCSENDIKKDVQKCLAEFTRSQEQKLVQDKLDAEDHNAQQVKSNLEGLTVKV